MPGVLFKKTTSAAKWRRAIEKATRFVAKTCKNLGQWYLENTIIPDTDVLVFSSGKAQDGKDHGVLFGAINRGYVRGADEIGSVKGMWFVHLLCSEQMSGAGLEAMETFRVLAKKRRATRVQLAALPSVIHYYRVQLGYKLDIDCSRQNKGKASSSAAIQAAIQKFDHLGKRGRPPTLTRILELMWEQDLSIGKLENPDECIKSQAVPGSECSKNGYLMTLCISDESNPKPKVQVEELPAAEKTKPRPPRQSRTGPHRSTRKKPQTKS